MVVHKSIILLMDIGLSLSSEGRPVIWIGVLSLDIVIRWAWKALMRVDPLLSGSMYLIQSEYYPSDSALGDSHWNLLLEKHLHQGANQKDLEVPGIILKIITKITVSGSSGLMIQFCGRSSLTSCAYRKVDETSVVLDSLSQVDKKRSMRRVVP